MGKPRLILLVRHGISQGNANRDIHQYVPDHRVKLTPEGHQQAAEAGRRLRALLRKDDTIQVFTSPYRRTRETTEGILKTLTGDDEELGPSPFERDNIKVYEEPRLREQDFGNFQPCSVEMERMWQERADYGHFFYRIPNGESAADAYDRISGFNESLWRQFGDADFPSVCILVTHGLMTRVFLMKWYHWSVEYFEDLRNINHCEFIIMEKDDNGKYSLQNKLRTWTEFQARTAAATGTKVDTTPTPFAMRRWGGCAMGCNHHNLPFPRRTKRLNSMDIPPQLPSQAIEPDEQDDHPIASQDADHANGSTLSKKSLSSRKLTGLTAPRRPDPLITDDGTSPTDADGLGAHGGSSADDEGGNEPLVSPSSNIHRSTPHTHTHRSIRGGGNVGVGSGDPSDESDFFDTNVHQLESRVTFRGEASLNALTQIDEADERRSDRRRSSPASPRYRKGGGGKASWGKGGGKKMSAAVGAVSEEEEEGQEVGHGKKQPGEMADEEGDGGEPKEGSAAAEIY